MPGKDDIYWRRLGEELLGSDLLLFAGEVFASENSIVSELGWDLSLALKGLSLGNEINKRPVLASQRAMMWQLTKENREEAVGDIVALFLRSFKNCIDAHGGAAPECHPGWFCCPPLNSSPVFLHCQSFLTHSSKRRLAGGNRRECVLSFRDKHPS